MLKKDALQLMDKRVSVWTAANGVYVGVLKEVFGSPWRGKVLIDGVLELATHFENGAVCRRGFRPGETIEAGGSSIRPAEAAGQDYEAALVQAIAQHREQLARDPEGRYAWMHKGYADAQEVVLETERRRLHTGEWRLQEVLEERRKQAGA